MTVADLHKAFKVHMDKNSEAVAFGGCPAFLPEEIDLFLNQAFIEVICNKFTGHNTLQIPFEGSVKRVADLENLVKTDADLIVQNTGDNVLTLNDFSHDNTRMLFVSALLHCEAGTADCKVIDHATANRFIKTFDNDPYITNPVCVQENNSLKIYYDIHSMKGPYSLELTYVTYPPTINYTTPDTVINIVPDRVLYEVVNRAVIIALENIESKRTQSKSQTNDIQE